MSDVFLSYASADRGRVATLVHALEAQGLKVWWDRDITYGDSFHTVIEQALTAAGCVIVAWSEASIASEWVLNEASDARKRARLLPVLLDPVTPPLEFRHLQAADLSRWQGDAADERFTGLQRAVQAMLGRGDTPRVVTRVMPSRHWLQTRAGQALGAGILLLGVCVLLITLKQVGWIGAASPAVTDTQTAKPNTPGHVPGAVIAASAGEPLNLLDTEAGARLVAASEDGWKRLFSGRPTYAIVSRHGFAVLGVRGDKPAMFDTLAVFVDSTDTNNIKDLVISTSNESAEGPFVRVATVTLPNHRNMEMPFHELRFAPAQARFVKLEAASLRNDYGPNGNLGSIQLYASGR